MTRRLTKLTYSLLLTTLVSCGGGGGGGDSTPNSDNGSLKKGIDTALRVIHANIQAAPIVVKVADRTVQQSRFAQENFYTNIDSGAVELRIEQLNGTVLGTVPANFQSRTEYTLLALLGANGQPRFSLLTDIAQQPAAGFSNVRVINAIKEAGDLTVEVAGVSFSTLSDGEASEFISIPSGQVVMVARNGSGAVVSQATINLEDQAELTLLLAGDTDLGFVTVKQYKDLD